MEEFIQGKELTHYEDGMAVVLPVNPISYCIPGL